MGVKGGERLGHLRAHFFGVIDTPSLRRRSESREQVEPREPFNQ